MVFVEKIHSRNDHKVINDNSESTQPKKIPRFFS